MTPELTPAFRSLDGEESEEILARNHVGRLAFASRGLIDVQPIGYVYEDGWIYGRTSPGIKMETLGGGWWPVAFEVDEVEAPFRWRSVIVHGGFYLLPADAEGPAAQAREQAIELLRRLMPETFTDQDPAPFRDLVFRIAVQECTGREALVPGD